MRSSLLRTAVQGLLGSNPAVGIGAAVVGVTGLTVGGVIGVTSVTHSACASPAHAEITIAGVGSPGSATTADEAQCEDTSPTSGVGGDPSTGIASPADSSERTDGSDGAPSSEPSLLDDRVAGDPSGDTPVDAPAAPGSGSTGVADPTAGPTLGATSSDVVTTTTGPQPFRISGTVTGLTPGVPRRLRLRIDNPNSESIRLLEISVDVGDLPGCPGSNLRIEGYRAAAPGAARVIVPARASATVDVQAGLLAASAKQDACRNRTFPLSFRGTAEQWSGR